MVLEVSVYFLVYVITTFMALLYQRTLKKVTIIGLSKESKLIRPVFYCLVGCLFILPIIAMSGLRYGIGADYFSYENIYNTLHFASFKEYWVNHSRDVGAYYVEPAYYVLNRVIPSYRLLLWTVAILEFALFFLVVKDYSAVLNIPFALFIFLAIQFIYSLNVMRFTIAVCLILLGYNFLSRDKTLKFVICVLTASLFHISALFCLAMFFLKRCKHKGINNFRNIVFFTFILLFPIVNRSLLHFVEIYLPIFGRYFTKGAYAASETISPGWKWLLHIIPVMLPLILFCRKEILAADETKTLFRICIMEIPFRTLAFYNRWYTRFTRYAQIGLVVFIPLVLAKIGNKQKRIALYIYYILWYTFYFAYYAIVNDEGCALPYEWIFSH